MAAELFRIRTDCRLCHSNNLKLAISLGEMPIATTNFQLSHFDRSAPLFRTPVPLELHHCADCGHLQISHIGNPEIQYRDYVYTTSISLGLREHFRSVADTQIKCRGLKQGAFVVELGSNDGTLLAAFKERGMKVLGIDPAVEIASRATKSGVETLPDFFDEAVGKKIANQYGRADLIIANNMIANVDDLDTFMRGIAALLKSTGTFVFETQYGVDVTEKNLLDTIYHEHLSYFKVRPLVTFLERFKMKVIAVEDIWTKGGSIRVAVQFAEGPDNADLSVAEHLNREKDLRVDNAAYFEAFAKKVSAIRAKLHDIVDRCHAEGKTVAGYGVSVGTLALLTQFDLTQKIDFLCDDDTTKGDVLSGPDYDIPIVKPEQFSSRAAPITVVFAWRYADAIAKKQPDYFASGGKFVIPLPDVSIRAGA